MEKKKDFRFYPRERATKFLSSIDVKIKAEVIDEETAEITITDPKTWKKSKKILSNNKK